MDFATSCNLAVLASCTGSRARTQAATSPARAPTTCRPPPSPPTATATPATPSMRRRDLVADEASKIPRSLPRKELTRRGACCCLRGASHTSRMKACSATRYMVSYDSSFPASLSVPLGSWRLRCFAGGKSSQAKRSSGCCSAPPRYSLWPCLPMPARRHHLAGEICLCVSLYT